jgi:hypothetical protein
MKGDLFVEFGTVLTFGDVNGMTSKASSLPDKTAFLR